MYGVLSDRPVNIAGACLPLCAASKRANSFDCSGNVVFEMEKNKTNMDKSRLFC